MWKAIFQNKLTIYKAIYHHSSKKIIKSRCYVDLSRRLRVKSHPKMAAWERLIGCKDRLGSLSRFLHKRVCTNRPWDCNLQQSVPVPIIRKLRIDRDATTWKPRTTFRAKALHRAVLTSRRRALLATSKFSLYFSGSCILINPKLSSSKYILKYHKLYILNSLIIHE
jgi:hypothetical protein